MLAYKGRVCLTPTFVGSTMRIGIVAGETSGDMLGAGLITALKAIDPNITIEGIAGHRMIEAGCKMICPMDRISVMGFIEPLRHLPDILHARRQLLRYFIQNPPDIFVGIDAPDFNLSIELKLKKLGVKTVHYVSPTVWGWRQGRIHKIKRAVDLMLTLFPFETEIYEKNQVPVQFVGHPLADAIPLDYEQWRARKALKLPVEGKILAILPGSRKLELKNLAEQFIQTASWCRDHEPTLQIITAMVNKNRRRQFENILQRVAPDLPIQIYDEKSQTVIAASDVLLLASGTVTLEGLLFEKPMVVAYKMARMTFQVMKRLVKVKNFALPNLIAGRPIVPEFLQKEVSPIVMGPILLGYLNNPDQTGRLAAEFLEIHKLLKHNANESAARAILDCL